MMSRDKSQIPHCVFIMNAIMETMITYEQSYSRHTHTHTHTHTQELLSGCGDQGKVIFLYFSKCYLMLFYLLL